MKRIIPAVMLAASALLTLSALVFGIWVNQANADFQAALNRTDGNTPIVAQNTPSSSVAGKTGYILVNGKLVGVTPEQLALEAWNKDQLLPGKDMHYNYVEIGGCISHWEQYFALGDDKEFEHAYTAIAHRSEERLKEQAFRSTQ